MGERSVTDVLFVKPLTALVYSSAGFQFLLCSSDNYLELSFERLLIRVLDR